MARKQSPPRVIDSHLGRKAQQASASIAGKGRRTLFTATTLSNGGTLIAAELLTHILAAQFFRSAGDAVVITFFGRFDDTAGVNSLFITILDEDNNTLIQPLSASSAGSGGVVPVYGDCIFLLDENKVIRGGGRLSLQDDVTPLYSRVFAPSAGSALSAKKIKTFITANAAGADTVAIDYLQAEYCPAAIT